MIRNLVGAVSALAFLATPIAASAAPVANPAASLSVANSVRAGAPAHAGKSDAVGGLGGGALIAVLIVAGVIAIGVIAAVDNDDSDSN